MQEGKGLETALIYGMEWAERDGKGRDRAGGGRSWGGRILLTRLFSEARDADATVMWRNVGCPLHFVWLKLQFP